VYAAHYDNHPDDNLAAPQRPASLIKPLRYYANSLVLQHLSSLKSLSNQGSLVFGGGAGGFLMTRWARQFGLIRATINQGGPDHQRDFQDPEKTTTILLTWARAWAAYLGAHTAQAVHQQYVVSFSI